MGLTVRVGDGGGCIVAHERAAQFVNRNAVPGPHLRSVRRAENIEAFLFGEIESRRVLSWYVVDDLRERQIESIGLRDSRWQTTPRLFEPSHALAHRFSGASDGSFRIERFQAPCLPVRFAVAPA